MKALEASVDAWSRSRRPREYLPAMAADVDPGAEALQAWLTGQREYADWLGPPNESSPSVLDEPDHYPYW